MKDLKARDIMTRPVISALQNASARDIALQMLSGAYSGMPVTDGDGAVIGLVTELDLLSQIDRGKELVKLTAAEVMTKDPVTIDADAPLHEVLQAMQKTTIVRVPVTRDGYLVGIIARSDILKSFVEPEFVSHK